jgi:hypothetical protein
MATTATPSRALPLVAGGALATIGSVLALAGGAVLAVGGDDGMVTSDYTHALSTPTNALVSSPAQIDDEYDDVASVIGAAKIGITATSPRAVFVGVGPRKDVDRYLRGTGVDEATDFEVDPLRLEITRHPGTRRPAPPATQSFWVESASGQRAKLDWKIRHGDYRMVVMNADGSRGVATASRVEAGAEHLPTIGLSVLLAGVVTAAGGAAVMVGRRR